MRGAVFLAAVVAMIAGGSAYLLFATTSNDGSSFVTACGFPSVSSRDFEDVEPTVARDVAYGEKVEVEVPPGKYKLMVSAQGGRLEQLPRPPPVDARAPLQDGCPAEPAPIPLAATADLAMRVYVLRFS